MIEPGSGSDIRLDGLEPDNLLAFLALLGLLRALNHSADSMTPRISWTIDEPPVRPRLHLRTVVTRDEIARQVSTSLDGFVGDYSFGNRKDLNYERNECRDLLKEAAEAATWNSTGRPALLSALMSDAAIKDGKDQIVDPTPLCLLFGQGHQHFLQRLSEVPASPAPPPRGRGKSAVQITGQECISEALFHPWQRNDQTQSFRWDPLEDVRYALMAGDPTDGAYKSGTQHGANRLATVGLATLILVPEFRAKRIRPRITGGENDSAGFSFAWPIWREPATLAAIVAVLTHPQLRRHGALKHLGVEFVMVARRISTGKFMNFARARPLAQAK